MSVQPAQDSASDCHMRIIMESLARRLEEDPEEFCCPISLCLFEDPVRAEDGKTYERKAIQEALRHRTASPLTNLFMGRRLVPDEKMKTAIVEFKEKLVEEVVSHAPFMSHLQALKLLFRAEGFVREKLPDPIAKDSLMTILMRKAQLPSPLRGDALVELCRMCQDATVDLKMVVEKFVVKLGMKSQLADLDDQTIARFCLAAHVPPKSPCCHAVDREQACRLALKSFDEFGARQLWKFVQKHAVCGNPEWVKAAALVMAARHNLITVSPELPCNISRQAVDYMQDRAMAVSHAREVFRTDLGLDDPLGGSVQVQAQLLLGMASQQEEPAAQVELLLEAAYVDPSNTEVLGHLKEFFTNELQSKGRMAREDAFISFLLDAHGCIPEEFLGKLPLEDGTIRALRPESAFRLADQLQSAGRGEDGAKVVLTACKELEEEGDMKSQVLAQQASLKAYNMSGYSQEALHLVLSITSRRLMQVQMEYQDLQQKCSEQEERIELLTSEQKRVRQEERSGVQPTMTVEWDVSHVDGSFMCKGESSTSPQFEIAGTGVAAWLRYYPQGTTSAEDEFASLYLFVDKESVVSCDVAVDTERKSMENSPIIAGGGRGWANFVKVGVHKKISISVHSVQLAGSRLTFVYHQA
ncbi:PUB51 [Symbiodinium natans]|uniref:PUB51 protein n=1 Tax=Symbiodinium natans TaxID=878477 RepID=A0A812KLF5_9DINO|nr:PUB51 [Symbiodinium natans]